MSEEGELSSDNCPLMFCFLLNMRESMNIFLSDTTITSFFDGSLEWNYRMSAFLEIWFRTQHGPGPGGSSHKKTVEVHGLNQIY